MDYISLLLRWCCKLKVTPTPSHVLQEEEVVDCLYHSAGENLRAALNGIGITH